MFCIMHSNKPSKETNSNSWKNNVIYYIFLISRRLHFSKGSIKYAIKTNIPPVFIGFIYLYICLFPVHPSTHNGTSILLLELGGGGRFRKLLLCDSRTGHQQNIWIVKTRMADKPHSSAIHAS